MDKVLELLLDLMSAVGAPGAGIAVFFENLFPPIPSEPVLAAAGIAASRGRIGYVDALVWCTIGSVAGAWVLYWLGRVLGLERLRGIADRLPLVKVSDIDKTQAWFEKHGSKAVLIGRVIPLFRSFISIPAGVTRMPFVKFTILTAIGSGVWNTLLISAGYFLGDNWETLRPVLSVMQYVVVIAIVVAMVIFVYRRVKEMKQRAAKPNARHDPELADLQGSVGPREPSSADHSDVDPSDVDPTDDVATPRREAPDEDSVNRSR